jgi:hypothetical protein
MKYLTAKGQEAVEFIIIAGLILLMALGTFFMFGDKIKAFFESDSAVVKVTNNTPAPINIQSQQKFTPDYAINAPSGSFNFGLEEPVSNCTGDKCYIDFGNFRLAELPPDFQKYVQAAGTSGTTNLLADYYYQIAQQMEEQGLTDESEPVKMLAVSAHNIAVIEKEFEKLYNDCNGNQTCLQAVRLNAFPKPDDFDETYMAFPENITYQNMLYAGCIGEALSVNKGATAYGIVYNPIPFEFLDTMDAVMSNDKIPDNIRNVVYELGWHVGTIGEDFENLLNYNGFLPGYDNYGYFDVHTGELAGNFASDIPQEDLDIKTYKASRITHFDATLVCAAGKGKDTGKKCH